MTPADEARIREIVREVVFPPLKPLTQAEKDHLVEDMRQRLTAYGVFAPASPEQAGTSDDRE